MSPCRVRVFPVSCCVFFSVSIRVLVFFKNWHIFLAIHAILRYSCLPVVFIFLSVSCCVFCRVLVIFSCRVKFVFVSCRHVVSRIARSIQERKKERILLRKKFKFFVYYECITNPAPFPIYPLPLTTWHQHIITNQLA